MSFLEINFSLSPAQPYSEILIAQLSEIGFDSFAEEDESLLGYIQEENFSEDEMKNILNQLSGCNISFTKKKLEEKNWNEEWEKNFEPVTVAGKICIRAPFHPMPANIMYDILVEPKMSFGTGHHETTALMAEEMLKINFTGKRICDAGCGTGVLAILASMMGTENIFAYDIDEWAYKNSVENITRNHINNIILKQGDASLLSGQKFDIILANINRNILLKDINQFANTLRQNGHLVLSGFFTTDLQAITDEAMKNNLVPDHHSEKNHWAVAVFHKQ